MMRSSNSEQETYELISLWLDEYRNAKTEASKSKFKALIVTRMLPIVRRIARTIARRSYDPVEDMVQAGSIGLLKAIDGYSKDINDNFKVYAGCLIIGEMRHYLRDKLNNIKVPGHIQELAYRINSFIGTLTQEELHNLTDDYVAEVLNIPKEIVNYARQADRRKETVSLDDIFSNENSNNLSYDEYFSKDDYVRTSEIEDAKLMLKKVIKDLPEDCKKVIELYYYNDYSQTDIAKELNLTQMQVHRKLKKSFALLYSMMSGNKSEIPFIGE